MTIGIHDKAGGENAAKKPTPTMWASGVDRQETATTRTPQMDLEDGATILLGQDERGGMDRETEAFLGNLGIKRQSSINHYLKLDQIGIGGVGVVYRGEDPELRREIAIKALRSGYRDDPRQIRRFIREAQVTAGLEHPNVVPVHELGYMDGLGVYFTMKRIYGENLKNILDHLRDGDPAVRAEYGPGRLLEIFLGICNAITFAHSKGVIHRDLKPANVIIGEYGEVLVVDWGLGSRLESDPSDTIYPAIPPAATEKEKQRVIVTGTPQYMSPEQIKGNRALIDRQTDVYSLGVILYQILTFQTPFEAENLEDLIRDVADGFFQRPRARVPGVRVAKELEAVCLKAMARKKEDRYPDVKSLSDDVRAFIGNLPVSAYRDPAAVKFWKYCVRHRVISTTLAVAILTLALGYGGEAFLNRSRYNTLLNAAEINRIEGDQEMETSQHLYQRFRDLTRAGGRFDSPELADIRRKLNRSQIAAENKYNVALKIYSVLEPYNYNRDLSVRCSEIFKKQIRYSLLMRDFKNAARLVTLLKMWVGEKYEKVTDEKKKAFEDIEKELISRGYM